MPEIVDFPIGLDSDLYAPIKSEFKITQDLPFSRELQEQPNEFLDIQATFDPRPRSGTGTGASFKYRMRGYNASLGQYEMWVTSDPTAANPSGNPLVAKEVEARLPVTS